MSEEQTKKLIEIYNTLNQVEVRGKNNYSILLACMNEIEKLIKENDDGNANSES